MIEYQSTSPTWAIRLRTTPIYVARMGNNTLNYTNQLAASPLRGANAAYLFRAKQGIAIGDPAGQISVVSTTILYDTTRYCLCGSPGCCCGAR